MTLRASVPFFVCLFVCSFACVYVRSFKEGIHLLGQKACWADSETQLGLDRATTWVQPVVMHEHLGFVISGLSCLCDIMAVLPMVDKLTLHVYTVKSRMHWSLGINRLWSGFSQHF